MKREHVVGISFGVCIAASLALVVVYLAGGQPQLEGLLLALAFGGIGIGFAVWAIDLMPSDEHTEERPPLASTKEAHEAADAASAPEVTRRRALLGLLAGAGGTLAGALAIPALSLGPQPGSSLVRTAWGRGARVVDADGNPVRPSDLIPESVTTVFPEGAVGSADAQTLLIRTRAELSLPEGRADWAPGGVVAYSKICTHAGCPVGLYRAESHELLCPCHQSTFDVLRGAIPTFGPAARPLPQLPLGLDQQGYLVALADFPEPVGPSFWNVHRSSQPEEDA